MRPIEDNESLCPSVTLSIREFEQFFLSPQSQQQNQPTPKLTSCVIRNIFLALKATGDESLSEHLSSYLRSSEACVAELDLSDLVRIGSRCNPPLTQESIKGDQAPENVLKRFAANITSTVRESVDDQKIDTIFLYLKNNLIELFLEILISNQSSNISFEKLLKKII